MVHKEESDSVLNTIIAVAKRFIWQQKFCGIPPNMHLFSKYFLKYLCTLKMIYIIKNRYNDFEQDWNDLFERLESFV